MLMSVLSLRYQFMLNDGYCHHSLVFLGRELNYMIHNGQLEKYAVIRMLRYLFTDTEWAGKQRKVVIISAVEVVTPGSAVGEKLGRPIMMKSDGSIPDAQNNNDNNHPRGRKRVRQEAEIPHCQVCLQTYSKDGKIFGCVNGHLLCAACRSQPSIQVCPRCRGEMTGRAHDYEDLVHQLWGQED